MSFSQVFQLIIAVLLLVSVVLYSKDLEWDRVNLPHCASSRLEFISPLHIGTSRAICFSVIAAVLLKILTSSEPLEVTVVMKDGSRKLVRCLHFNRCSFFTVWSWILMVTDRSSYMHGHDTDRTI